MTKSMESSSAIFEIKTSELIHHDDLLSKVKDGRDLFSLNQICLPSSPVESGFLFIKSKNFAIQYLENVKNNHIKDCIVVCDQTSSEVLKNTESISTCVVSKNIELSISRISKIFFDCKYGSINQLLDGRITGTAKIHPSASVSPLAFVGENVVIGEDVQIHPFAHIGAFNNISKCSTIFPNVTLYPYVSIGEKCRIHSGTIIGADGFGYVFHKGVHQKIWHIGGVHIGNNVEVGANSCIDSGTFLPTVVGDGSIIDNLVQVGHNTQIGKGVILCGQSGTGGSSKIGDFAVFGGKSAIGPQCEVGSQTKVAGAGMVTKNWGDSMELAGHPARPLKEWLKNLALVNRLSREDGK